jgi:hypothetical protein
MKMELNRHGSSATKAATMNEKVNTDQTHHIVIETPAG